MPSSGPPNMTSPPEALTPLSPTLPGSNLPPSNHALPPQRNSRLPSNASQRPTGTHIPPVALHFAAATALSPPAARQPSPPPSPARFGSRAHSTALPQPIFVVARHRTAAHTAVLPGAERLPVGAISRPACQPAIPETPRVP